MRFENPKTSKKPSCSGGISVAEIAVDHTTISQQGGIKMNQGEFHHGLQFKGGMHHHVFMFFLFKIWRQGLLQQAISLGSATVLKNSNAMHMW